jgi:hypothetical protein
MALMVKQNEALDPMDVSLLGAQAEMPQPNFLTHPVEQARRVGRGRVVHGEIVMLDCAQESYAAHGMWPNLYSASFSL